MNMFFKRNTGSTVKYIWFPRIIVYGTVQLEPSLFEQWLLFHSFSVQSLDLSPQLAMVCSVFLKLLSKLDKWKTNTNVSGKQYVKVMFLRIRKKSCRDLTKGLSSVAGPSVDPASVCWWFIRNYLSGRVEEGKHDRGILNYTKTGLKIIGNSSYVAVKSNFEIPSSNC